MNLDVLVDNHPDTSVVRLMRLAAPHYDYTAAEMKREIIARKV